MFSLFVAKTLILKKIVSCVLYLLNQDGLRSVNKAINTGTVTTGPVLLVLNHVVNKTGALHSCADKLNYCRSSPNV